MATKEISRTVTRLQKAEIDAEDYGRAPVAREIFATSIRPPQPGTIRIHEGDANIEVRTSKKFRQAVVAVEENKRTITRPVVVESWRTTEEWEIKQRATSQFPIIVEGIKPRAVGDVVELPSDAERNLRRGRNWDTSEYRRYRVNVEANLKASTQYLLMGMDETAHFIAALREPVNSVKEAHEALRPDGVTWNAQRQGEWFFVPVSDRVSQRLDKAVEQNPSRLVSRSLETFGSHRANQLIKLDGEEYALGFITDTRRAHHSPLYLPDWHRVVRNREVAAPKSAPRMRQTWD